MFSPAPIQLGEPQQQEVLSPDWAHLDVEISSNNQTQPQMNSLPVLCSVNSTSKIFWKGLEVFAKCFTPNGMHLLQLFLQEEINIQPKSSSLVSARKHFFSLKGEEHIGTGTHFLFSCTPKTVLSTAHKGASWIQHCWCCELGKHFGDFHFYQAKPLNYGSRGNEEKKAHCQKAEIYSTGVHTCTGKIPTICKLRGLLSQY